ncbi:WxL protein peptidoglycan domain-containing protein [Streptacidiphilus carbonis]|uniref:WxL protein peptidoglycan domain-containing protein n=1 Tax=Streptacidiphilus carbonis TaxID=105422 RepID=UPI0005AB5FE6|nr:DUF916 domain-containing protein [Streptacidiphilus carbonis]
MFHRRPLTPRLLRVLLAALLAVGGLLLGAGPAPAAPAVAPALAPAADNGSWAVYPIPASKARDALPDREYFYLEAAPGASVSDTVSVFNTSDQPITFQVYGADAYNTPRDGGFALRAADQPQLGVGAWAHLKANRLTVPAHHRADVPFTITVPEGAEPGDHPGAIVALDTATEGTAGGGKVAVGIKRAVGARVYLRVSGPAVPAVTVQDVSVSRKAPLVPGIGGSSATIRYTLVNRGNTTVHPTLAVRASGWFGGTVLDSAPKDLGIDLLPGQSVTLTAPWPHPPQFDRVSLKLSIAGTDVSATAGTSFFAVPWFLVGLVMVLIGLLIGARRLRARRRGAQGGGWSWRRGRVRVEAAA